MSEQQRQTVDPSYLKGKQSERNGRLRSEKHNCQEHPSNSKQSSIISQICVSEQLASQQALPSGSAKLDSKTQLRRSPRFKNAQDKSTTLIEEQSKLSKQAIVQRPNSQVSVKSNYEGYSGSSEKSIYSIYSQQPNKEEPTLRSKGSLEIMVEQKSFKFKIERGTEAQHNLTNYDLHTLKENRCLNDGVINAYIKLLSLNRRANHTMVLANTYFYDNFKSPDSAANSQRITKLFQKMKLNDLSEVLVPVHWKKRHWVFIIMSRDVIRIYDSIANKGPLPKPIMQFQQYLFKNANVPRRVEIFPQQEGNADCGVYALCGIRSFVLGVPFEKVFLPSIAEIRKNIATELCEWKIMEW